MIIIERKPYFNTSMSNKVFNLFWLQAFCHLRREKISLNLSIVHPAPGVLVNVSKSAARNVSIFVVGIKLGFPGIHLIHLGTNSFAWTYMGRPGFTV